MSFWLTVYRLSSSIFAFSPKNVHKIFSTNNVPLNFPPKNPCLLMYTLTMLTFLMAHCRSNFASNYKKSSIVTPSSYSKTLNEKGLHLNWNRVNNIRLFNKETNQIQIHIKLINSQCPTQNICQKRPILGSAVPDRCKRRIYNSIHPTVKDGCSGGFKLGQVQYDDDDCNDDDVGPTCIVGTWCVGQALCVLGTPVFFVCKSDLCCLTHKAHSHVEGRWKVLWTTFTQPCHPTPSTHLKVQDGQARPPDQCSLKSLCSNESDLVSAQKSRQIRNGCLSGWNQKPSLHQRWSGCSQSCGILWSPLPICTQSTIKPTIIVNITIIMAAVSCQ